MKKLLKSFTTVTVLSVLTRLLSMLCKILLARTLSSFDLGVYQSALSVFAIAMTVISSGFPLSVSRAFAQGRKGEKSLFASSAICLFAAVVLCLIAFLFGEHLSFLFADSKSVFCLKLLLPAVVVSAMYCSLRGALWGRERFFAFSFAEFFEEIAYAAVILVLVLFKPTLSVAIPCMAITISSACSCLYSFIAYFSGGGKVAFPSKYDCVSVVKSSTPIISTRLLASATSAILTLILPKMITLSGKTLSEALSLIGVYSAVVVPLLFAPSSIVGSLCLVLLPKIAKSEGSNKLTTLYSLSFGACLSALVVSLYLSLAGELTLGVFGKRDASYLLSLSCLAIFPMSLNQLSGSILNSLGLERESLKSFISGAVVSIVCVLTLSPFISIYAECVAVTLQAVVSASVNLLKLSKTLYINKKELLLSLSPFLLVCVLFPIGFCAEKLLQNAHFIISIAVVGAVVLGMFFLSLALIIPDGVKKALTKR